MNAITKPEATAIAPRTGGFDLSPQTFEQAMTFSTMLADSDLVPKDFKGKPGNCMIAMQWGCELGLKPLQALQNIAVINGRAALWGDAVIALVRSSPVCEYVIEEDDGSKAICRVKRRGEAEQVRTFSMQDAEKAGLMGKSGPWTQYPKRMRQMRARAFALRDVFPDVLRGMPIAEEVMDIPAAGEKHMGPAQEVGAPAAAPAPITSSEQAAYPKDDFDKNLQSWLDVISSGKKTAEQIIAMVSTKGTLTDAQKDRIRGKLPADIAPSGAPDAEGVIEGQARTVPAGSAE